MIEFFAYVFIAAWFIFWGYVLLTRPDTFFKVNQMGQDNMKKAANGAAKATQLVTKLWWRR